MKTTHLTRGFTLMELMIVLTIVGILVAIAFPAYQSQMISSRRTDGQAALLNMSSLMEAYYTENNTYVGANTTALGITNLSQQGYYTVGVAAINATSYTLTATPVPTGPQAADTICGPLSITNTAVKTPNPATCWN
jgi:type IV pilus assembly protein PilE